MARSSSSSTDNGLIIEGYDGLFENVDDYRKGGNHPVQISSRVGNYEFVDKIGVHRDGLEWLCLDVDTKKYVSLLILEANVNDYMQLKYVKKEIEGTAVPIDHFKVNGPNGSHHVLVYVPTGRPLETSMRRDKQKLKRLCHKTTMALANLHSNKICHGGE